MSADAELKTPTNSGEKSQTPEELSPEELSPEELSPEELSMDQLGSITGGTGNNNNQNNNNNPDPSTLPCGGVGCGITHGHE